MENIVQHLGELSIVGAAMTVFVQVVKRYFGTTELGTQTIAVLAALILSGVYYVLKDTPAWAAFLVILGTATLLYDYILSKFKSLFKPSEPE